MTVGCTVRQSWGFTMVKGHLFSFSMNKYKGLYNHEYCLVYCQEYMLRISEKLIYIKIEKGTSVYK